MASVEKSLEKFKRSLDAGTIYEAQQLIKTAYYRVRSRKLLEESRQLLKEATCLQLDHSQVACATELAKLLVEAYNEDKLPADANAVGRILRILDGISATSSGATAEYTSIAKAAIKWASSVGGSPEFVGQLHAQTGKYLWDEQGLDGLRLACAHMARSTDMYGYATLLGQASKALDVGEPELLAAHAIFGVLTVPGKAPLQQIKLARELLRELQQRMCLPINSPMSNFLKLLIEALEHKSQELVQLLIREYSNTLANDPHLMTEIQAVEAAHCGSQSNGQGLEGIFGNIMRSIMASE